MAHSRLLHLGTRGSLLASTQSQMVADELMRLHSGLRVELVIVKTTGDRIQDKPLADAGGKGLFTKELEQALLAKRIDFAVHSYKDVPVTMPLVDQSELIIVAVPKREDPSDVLVCEKARSIQELPKGARVGTGSLRRKAQLLEHRPDLSIQSIRGNIDTRLRKLRDGECDALILAAAGLKRCGLFDASIMSPLTNMLPAAGQGALAIQCRKDDLATQKVLASLDDSESRACVDAERAIVAGLNGDCHSPIAALAKINGSNLHLRAAVAAREGELPIIHAESESPADHAAHAVNQVLDQLRHSGAHKLLHGKD